MTKRIVKQMTIEQIEADKIYQKMNSRVEALKSKMFVREKTLVDALNAKDEAHTSFWLLVTKTWPKLKGMSAQKFSDNTIVFNLDD